MDKCIALLVVCLAVFSSGSLKLPTYIKQCSIKDPDFNKCALKNAREALPTLVKGDRKYNIPVLDPLLIKEISAVDGNLDLAGSDINIVGIKDAVLENINFDFDKKIIIADVLVPDTYFAGKYKLNGKLLNLPISGNGPFNATFTDLRVKYRTGYDLTKLEDGNVYIVPKDYKVDFEPKNVVAYLDNLFNGNKVLADAMNKFINENWREVLKQLGQPTYDAISLVINNILTGIAKSVPYKDVIGDTE